MTEPGAHARRRASSAGRAEGRVLAWAGSVAQMSHHHHDHDEHAAEGEPSSTGFLPLTLALTLFVTGLFVLGYIRCGG